MLHMPQKHKATVHGSGPSGPPLPMTLGIRRCGRRLSARHWVFEMCGIIDDTADFCHHSMPDEADGGGGPTNSWLEEFERETLREGEAMSHWQRAQAQHAGFAAISQSPADARDLNRNMADKYYTSAKYWQEGARINFKSGRWANSVWDAQQVCEFAIKGVILGTCGLTEEQKKGVGAHDLMLPVCDP